MDPAAAGPSAGRDRVLAIRRSRSPEHSLIKGENTPSASITLSRRAGIQLRRAQQQMAVRPQATSDRQRALPVRGHAAAPLVLFTQGLGVGFTVGIEEFLSALLPRRFEFGRRDVPVRSAFLGNAS